MFCTPIIVDGVWIGNVAFNRHVFDFAETEIVSDVWDSLQVFKEVFDELPETEQEWESCKRGYEEVFEDCEEDEEM